jgi:hypothetical protein
MGSASHLIDQAIRRIGHVSAPLVLATLALMLVGIVAVVMAVGLPAPASQPLTLAPWRW